MVITKTFLPAEKSDARGHRRLAAAVVVHAVEQFTGKRLSPQGLTGYRSATQEQRRDAERFLMSDGLDFWCDIAGMDPMGIRERVL